MYMCGIAEECSNHLFGKTTYEPLASLRQDCDAVRCDGT